LGVRNHDLDARNPEGEKRAGWLDAVRSPSLAVDGDTVSVGDTLFTLCPWWDGPYARARVERMLADASQQRTGRWIWVYHAPPTGLLSWTGKRHFGDSVLPDLIRRHSPTAVLCGHIHEAPFKNGGSWIDRIENTWLFNAGRQIGDVPARIEIDFVQQAARWISLAGLEERRFSNPERRCVPSRPEPRVASGSGWRALVHQGEMGVAVRTGV
jgi:hypothetical protein